MNAWIARLAAITCVTIGGAPSLAMAASGDDATAQPARTHRADADAADTSRISHSALDEDPAIPASIESDANWILRPVRIAAFWENDGGPPGLFSESDKHYTNGLKLDIAWQPRWADDIAPYVPFHDHFGGPIDTAVGLSVSQVMFTPRNLKTEKPIPHDEPYAGWLAFSAYWQRAGSLAENIAMFDHIEIDAGIVGQWSGAEALQKAIHAMLPDQQRPNGWGNQLHNEPAFDLTVRRKLRFSSGKTDSGFEFQAIPSIGGTLGTVYRQIEGSVTARFGWNLPDDFGPRRLADVGAATGGWSTDFGIYAFVRGQAQLIEHNTFLDGSNWHDSLSVSKEPFMLEVQVGFVALLWRHFEVGWSETFQTDGFEDEPGGGQRFGAITLAWVASF